MCFELAIKVLAEYILLNILVVTVYSGSDIPFKVHLIVYTLFVTEVELHDNATIIASNYNY